jgi:flagellar capping protein FliD
VLGRLEGMLDDLLDDSTAPNGRNVDGLLDARKATIQRHISDHDDEIERLELRLERLEESLVLKFSNLEQLMSGLQSQQAFLNANLASLNTRR